MTRKRARPQREGAAVVATASPPAAASPPAPPAASAGGWRDAVVVFAIALLVRLLHVWQMRGTLYLTVLMGDSRGYDRWAEELAAGDWIGREVFYQAPLYPYFLGTIYAIAGRDLLVVRLVQAVLGALSCVLLGYAGRRWLSPASGLAAGIMLALYPPAIFFDALIQKSVLDVLFMCASLALIARVASGGQQVRHWLLLGVVLGALSLTRENALVLAAIVAFWAIARGSALDAPRPRWSSRWRNVAALTAGGLLVLGPVLLRNYAVGGGFHVTTSQFGSNLFIGNNPRADGSYVGLRAGRGSPEYERIDARALAEEQEGRALTAGEVSSYWTRRTLEYIGAQPGDWLRLLARKLRLLASRTELIDTEAQESHAEYSWPLRRLGPVWHFGVALPLAVFGAVVLWPERRRVWLLYAMTAAYALSVVAFFVVARYRHPLMPLLFLFAGAGVSALAAAARRGHLRRLAVPAAWAAAAALAANWPLAVSGAPQAITENNLGTALQEDGRLDDAIDRYKRALAFDPQYAPALNNVGTALRAAGRVDEAIAAYEAALARTGEGAGTSYNLGNALMAKGDAAAAAAAFRQALAANPRFLEAANNLGRALAASGDAAGAIEAFRGALAIDDRSVLAHGNLGNLLATQGAYRAATTHFERAVTLSPDDAAIRYDFGSMLIEAGAFDAAATQLSAAIRLKPDYAEAHNNLGIALASQGRLGDAVGEWETAVRLKPDFADARRNLERAKTR
jgi:tetratricopeptide (TPR) repeat protein